eukprot:UN03422
MGVVGALVAGMLYPFVISPPLEMGNEGWREQPCVYI